MSSTNISASFGCKNSKDSETTQSVSATGRVTLSKNSIEIGVGSAATNAISEGNSITTPIAGSNLAAVLLDQIGYISTVCETYGYIQCAELDQSVFFPGSSYQPHSGEPNRLNAVFKPRDLVCFHARPQAEMNGCTWIAESVFKLEEQPVSSGTGFGEFLPEGLCTEGSESRTIEKQSTTVSSEGKIHSLTPYYGFIESKDLESAVYFPILAWAGGVPASPTAETLLDVLSQGDDVLFQAVAQNQPSNDCFWRAVRVTKVSCVRNQGSQTAFWTNRNQCRGSTGTAVVSSKYSQTLMDVNDLVYRAIKSDRELYEQCVNRFPFLMRFAERNE